MKAAAAIVLVFAIVIVARPAEIAPELSVRPRRLSKEEQSIRLRRLPIAERIAVRYIVQLPSGPIEAALKEDVLVEGETLRLAVERWNSYRALNLSDLNPASELFWELVEDVRTRETLEVLPKPSSAHARELVVTVAQRGPLPIASKAGKSSPGAIRTVMLRDDVILAAASQSTQPRVATHKAKEGTNAEDAEPTSTQPIPPVNSDPTTIPYAFTHGGVRMLSPYTLKEFIDPSTGRPQQRADGKPTGALQLDSDKTNVGGFFEFYFSNVWAWRTSRQKATFGDEMNEGSHFQYVFAGLRHRKYLPERLSAFFKNSWDLTTRVSFEFGKDEQATANAITGSGDFNAELTLDKHIARGVSADSGMAFSTNLTVALAGVTDRRVFKVHPRVFYGLSLNCAFDDPFSNRSNPRKVWLRIQAGGARIDRIFFEPPDPNDSKGDTVSNRLVRTRGGFPIYEQRHATAFTTEVFWPLREYALLTLGTQIYGKTNPAPWSLYLGVTLPIVSLADSVAPK